MTAWLRSRELWLLRRAVVCMAAMPSMPIAMINTAISTSSKLAPDWERQRARVLRRLEVITVAPNI
jgi:hypothetical protein